MIFIFLERHLMVIFFLGLILLNTSINCCTPPIEREDSNSLVSTIVVTTSTNTSLQPPRSFNPLLESTLQLPLSYFEKQNFKRTVSPRRQARIEEEQRTALAKSYFDWPGSTAPLTIGSPAIVHVCVSSVTELICP